MRVVLLAALLVTVGLAVADGAAAVGAFVKVCAQPTVCAGPIGANVNSFWCRPVLHQGAAGASASAWVCA